MFELLPKEEILFDVFCISVIPVVTLTSDVSRYVTYCHYCANQRFIGCRNNACYCSVTRTFEYQKKYDVNVCKQNTSLCGHGTPQDRFVSGRKVILEMNINYNSHSSAFCHRFGVIF